MFKGGGMGGVNSLSLSTNHPSGQEVRAFVMLEAKGMRFGVLYKLQIAQASSYKP
jgi:hypothetical protein